MWVFEVGKSGRGGVGSVLRGYMTILCGFGICEESFEGAVAMDVGEEEREIVVITRC